MRYDIFTEYKENIEQLILRYFDGFTLISSIGYWKDIEEKSVIIIIVTDRENDILLLAKDFIRVNDQKSVLIIKAFPYEEIWII